MGDLVFVVVVVGGLALFFYRQWNDSGPICQSIDDSLAAVEETAVEETAVEETAVEEAAVEETAVEEAAVEEAAVEETVHNALAWRVLQRIMEDPGILQVELYKSFPREKRKHLQATLLQLDKEQVLRREREGNSYRLFPV